MFRVKYTINSYLLLLIVLYLFKRKFFLYFRKWNPAHFSQAQKINKISPEKISYATGNGNGVFLSLLKKNCSYILGNENPEFFFIFQETELSELSNWKQTTLKMFLIF